MTAEEFFRNKIRELWKNKIDTITLSNELITAETAFIWAFEYAKLYYKQEMLDLLEDMEDLDAEYIVKRIKRKANGSGD